MLPACCQISYVSFSPLSYNRVTKRIGLTLCMAQFFFPPSHIKHTQPAYVLYLLDLHDSEFQTSLLSTSSTFLGEPKKVEPLSFIPMEPVLSLIIMKAVVQGALALF